MLVKKTAQKYLTKNLFLEHCMGRKYEMISTSKKNYNQFLTIFSIYMRETSKNLAIFLLQSIFIQENSRATN